MSADPDMRRKAWQEDGMPRPHVPNPGDSERTVWDPKRRFYVRRCCSRAQIDYGCTCTYRTVCPDHGTTCHGSHE